MPSAIEERVIRQLIHIVAQLKMMNENHVEIGRLVKTWLETEPEEVSLEEMDREPLTVGKIVRVQNIASSMHKYIGDIVSLSPGTIRVRFQLGMTETFGHYGAGELEILAQPELHEGDSVRVIDPSSIVYKQIGKVLDPVYTDTTVEVLFNDDPKSGGEIERRHLELVQTRGEAMGSSDLEVDDIVEVIEPKVAHAGRTGTIIGFRKDGTVRVIFKGEEGYALYIPAELAKVGEQLYKEK